jgi:putative tryptophan/tyrosine transport system substrate-binding protein
LPHLLKACSNIRIDYRWGSGDTGRFRKYAAELVGLSPDVILGTAASIVRALQEASRTIPIVFVTTIDPVGSGLVASLSHPGGNATGFISFEFSLSAKLLELLKEIAPGVNRVAVLRDPTVPAGSGGFAAIQTAAPSFGVELTAIDARVPMRSSAASPNSRAPPMADCLSSVQRHR